MSYKQLSLEFVMENIPVSYSDFMRRHSFVALAWLVEEGYVKVDKNMVLQFGGDDDAD